MATLAVLQVFDLAWREPAAVAHEAEYLSRVHVVFLSSNNVRIGLSRGSETTQLFPPVSEDLA